MLLVSRIKEVCCSYRGKREEGRGKREEGRGKREEGREDVIWKAHALSSCPVIIGKVMRVCKDDANWP
jgi:hypothetical protein